MNNSLEASLTGDQDNSTSAVHKDEEQVVEDASDTSGHQIADGFRVDSTAESKGQDGEMAVKEEVEESVKKEPELSYLYLNGKDKWLTATNVEMKGGELLKFDALAPFSQKDEKGGEVSPTVEDANKIKRRLYQEFFKKSFKNILILSGAGSSIDVGLPLMSDLWRSVKQVIGDQEFEEICQKVKLSKENDFEALISRLEGYIQYNDDIEIAGKKLSEYRNVILQEVRDKTKVDEPKGKFPHVVFLQKLLQRKQTNLRVKVFTLNYDLLFEKAANKMNAVVIDGFSFTSPRTFSGRFFDYDIVQREGSKVNEEDNFVTRVFHLYKLHGSLNWRKGDHSDNIIIDDQSTDPLMIYPRDGKYKDSYGQPFFEMIARFQRNLRQDNDTLLICIGYSFNDNHINAAIEEAINQNPGFRMAVIDPGLVYAHNNGSSAYRNVVQNALESERIMLVSERFIDFADHYPEVKTYDNELRFAPINLRNEGQ